MERVDVFVVGGGGTGSDVTGALAGAGLSVALAERDKLGGECAHYGCDPTKAMLKAARVVASARRAHEYGVRVGDVAVDLPAVMARIRRLIDEETAAGARPFEELGARVFQQEARLTGPHRVELADGTGFEADRIVLATGSIPMTPPIPGLDAGGFWTSREAVWHGEGVPASLAVLGGGPIGVEFAQIYARFGSAVTVVEGEPHLLPSEEPEAGRAIAELLAADGVEVRTGAPAARVGRDGGRWRVEFGEGLPVVVDRLLVAVGRRPCFDEHDLEAAGIRLDDEGRPVLGDTLRTTARHIWIGGDAKGGLLFTHVANYDAEVIVADILGRPFPADYRLVPRVTYVEPEVGAVGLGESEAEAAGHAVATAFVPMSNNSRAFIDGEPAGFVKLVADRRTGELLGGHIVAPGAGELIHEIIAAMAVGRTWAAAGEAMHAYPTHAEAVREAFRELATRLREH